MERICLSAPPQLLSVSCITSELLASTAGGGRNSISFVTCSTHSCCCAGSEGSRLNDWRGEGCDANAERGRIHPRMTGSSLHLPLRLHEHLRFQTKLKLKSEYLVNGDTATQSESGNYWSWSLRSKIQPCSLVSDFWGWIQQIFDRFAFVRINLRSCLLFFTTHGLIFL